jgi:hypothetical protein
MGFLLLLTLAQNLSRSSSGLRGSGPSLVTWQQQQQQQCVDTGLLPGVGDVRGLDITGARLLTTALETVGWIVQLGV